MPASTSEVATPPAGSRSLTRAATARAAAAASPPSAPSARSTTSTDTASPARTRAAATAPASRTLASPQADAFDPTAGGRAALAAVRTCVVGDRSAQFGASLLYDVHSGLSRRVFFGGVEQLSRPERACLEKALIGLSAGAARQLGTLVTYTFRIAPTGDLVKAHLHPSP